MPDFHRYIGIDYSGAETATSSLKGLRVYIATPASPPEEVPPPTNPKRYWTRHAIAHWLSEALASGPRTLVGIDHGFSFPLRYFEVHSLKPDWYAFLEDFQRHWPTDEPHMYVEFVRDGLWGNGAARIGQSRWRRICDIQARAKSVFHFDVPGSVAKSTHAGLPWLLFLKRTLQEKVHFWPFDGWEPAEQSSVIAEIYPSLWNRQWPQEDRTNDQHDAYVIAAWMRQTDAIHNLQRHFTPSLTPAHKTTARVEGWILGVG